MDDDQQFCLRWNNHQSTLISVFDTLLENETLVDCTLAAEGKFLKAHKVVLSACSPYFATLLQEQYDKHPIFILKDVKYQELRAMMDYMYRGEVNISQDQLAALLKAAESLQIKGLSDNRSGGGASSAPKLEHHRGLNVPGSSGGKLSGYTLEQTQSSKRARIGPSTLDTQDMSASREGSSSPSRRRRKARRRSIENAMADVHDNSNSSQIQVNQAPLQQPQSNVNIGSVGAIAAVPSALASQMPVPAAPLSTGGSSAAVSASLAGAQAPTQQLTTNVTKKTESVKGTSDAMNTESVQVAGGAIGAEDHSMDHVKGDKHNHKQKSLSASAAAGGAVGKDSAEMVIEPKSEYDDEGNEETVEDLTLDDEEMGMEDLDQNAGTSQGGEGSSQGYAPWQHDRSQDELLLATQEAQQRDPQDMKYEFQSTMIVGSGELSGENPNERFPCAVCGKSYLRKRHLQRHMRDECIGIPPRFSCDLCPSRFRRKYHMVRHLISKHGIPSAVAQQTTGSGYRSGGESGCAGSVGGAPNNDCDNPAPENLSMKKDHYESENNIRSPRSPINHQHNGNINGGNVLGNAVVSNIVNDVAGVGPAAAVAPAPPIGMIPSYGLTGAITAISAAAAVVEGAAGIGGKTLLEAAAAAEDVVLPTAAIAAGASAIVTNGEQVTQNKNNAMEEDWKMKLSLQIISNSLLKERLLNTMPFAYNNN